MLPFRPLNGADSVLMASLKLFFGRKKKLDRCCDATKFVSAKPYADRRRVKVEKRALDISSASPFSQGCGTLIFPNSSFLSFGNVL
jgi:hypothetical protein